MVFRTVAAASAVTLLLTAQPALSATINVGPGESIQTAINSAAALGDEIVVAPGTYTELIDTQGKSITIRSSGGPLVTIIDGNGAGSVITCDDNEDGSTIIEGFTITGGTGTSNGIGGFEGGGLYCLNANPTIRRCVFTGNTASGPGGSGGGIYNFISSPRLANCLIYANSATTSGGGVMNDSASNPFILNSTIADNTAAQGGGVFSLMSTPRMVNCAVWSNNDDAVAGNAIITYSNIQNGFSGEGNINENPQWVNLNNGDFHLQSTSPCIDAGDSTAVANEIFKDIDGAPRGVNDPDTPDTGKASFGLVVDMGALELQVPCDGGPASCSGDLTGGPNGDPDGVVNVFDLFELLGNWGTCP